MRLEQHGYFRWIWAGEIEELEQHLVVEQLKQLLREGELGQHWFGLKLKQLGEKL